jgi:ethanolamine ammonia-lyase small subunit
MHLDPWQNLKSFTCARIAQGRAGGSLPTSQLLKFELDHARARDAVHQPFDAQALLTQATKSTGLPGLIIPTLAGTRADYLQRPDHGRTLSAESINTLKQQSPQACDIALIASDGLSALAAQRHAVPLLTLLASAFTHRGLTLAPLIIVPFARVAAQDPIGHALGARLSIILLGERPGLLSPDSLGAYLVYNPTPTGKSDADRNCISNIRPEGLPLDQAAQTILYLTLAALELKLTGVTLKDDRTSKPKLSGSFQSDAISPKI